MNLPDDRAVRAFTDVVAAEHVAPGLLKVVTWSDAYHVDARDAGCNCPDKEYNLKESGQRCKHDWGALVADVDELPSPFIVSDDLNSRVDCNV